MKASVNKRYSVKKGSVGCRFEYAIYGSPRRNMICSRGGKLVGDEDLFAEQSMYFLLSYFRSHGVRLSKSFKNWLVAEAMSALSRAADKLIINPKKQEEDVNNKQDEA